MPDADIDQAVEIAAAAIFSNNGVSKFTRYLFKQEQCDAGSSEYKFN